MTVLELQFIVYGMEQIKYDINYNKKTNECFIDLGSKIINKKF